MKSKYNVIENINVGLMGMPRFVQAVVFTGTKEECTKYETELRKTYKDRTRIDCWTEKVNKERYLYDRLTDAEKKDIIEVDGKKYIRKIYETNHR